MTASSRFSKILKNSLKSKIFLYGGISKLLYSPARWDSFWCCSSQIFPQYSSEKQPPPENSTLMKIKEHRARKRAVLAAAQTNDAVNSSVPNVLNSINKLQLDFNQISKPLWDQWLIAIICMSACLDISTLYKWHSCAREVHKIKCIFVMHLVDSIMHANDCHHR